MVKLRDITTNEAAGILNVSRRTLQYWRAIDGDERYENNRGKRGPDYEIKEGKAFYTKESLKRFIAICIADRSVCKLHKSMVNVIKGLSELNEWEG